MASHSWLVYALGGGFGHLTRACALARSALPDVKCRILTISPYAACVQLAMPELDFVTLDPAISMDQGRTEVLREITSASPECLIVDTFPRGLGGELVSVVSEFSGFKVFVQRDLNPDYVREYDLNAFVAHTYDLVLAPGDSNPDSLGPFAQTVTTAPWLMRSVGELLSRDRARQLLRLQDEKACVMVCAAGNPHELAWYGEVVSQLLESAPELNVRCIAPGRPYACPPDCWLSYWPAMDLYTAADVVIGGGGYNTIYECITCGVPLIAKAWPRKYDRQYLRARRATRIVDEPKDAVAAALELCGALRSRERHIRFENGASEAIAHIRRRSTASCEKVMHRTSHSDI